MTDNSKKKQYDVGYKKPPKSGQFKKGVSGNPKGAPRKEVKPDMTSMSRYPTRSIIREEGKRKIAIREGENVKEVTVTQAVMMALEKNALKGGVYAQRIYLDMQMREDEIHLAERRAQFERWCEIKAEAQAALAKAERDGQDWRNIAPHPDDIILKYSTYEVDIRGAVDAEGRQEELRRARLRDLMYELAIYYGEGNVKVDGDDEASKLGPYMGMYLITELQLPPSLRRSPDDLTADILRKSTFWNTKWADDLEDRCAEFELGFVYTPMGKHRNLAVPLKGSGIGWRNGRLVPVSAAMKRKFPQLL